jgi:hypothetical protein
MYPYLRSGLRRPVHALADAVCLVLLACSGGKDSTGPNPPDEEQPSIAGSYVLARINDFQPGQMVTLANPNGHVIGLFRFSESSQLDLTDDESWTLSLRFEDQTRGHLIENEGDFTRGGAAGAELEFSSDTSEDEFPGTAKGGVAAIKYDTDGDGQPDTIFGFTRK